MRQIRNEATVIVAREGGYYYPVNDVAKLFTSMVNSDRLTQHNIDCIGSLGYTVMERPIMPQVYQLPQQKGE